MTMMGFTSVCHLGKPALDVDRGFIVERKTPSGETCQQQSKIIRITTISIVYSGQSIQLTYNIL
jgi:hypothetical protein